MTTTTLAGKMLNKTMLVHLPKNFLIGSKCLPVAVRGGITLMQAGISVYLA
jgi:hypothetical protein